VRSRDARRQRSVEQSGRNAQVGRPGPASGRAGPHLPVTRRRLPESQADDTRPKACSSWSVTLEGGQVLLGLQQLARGRAARTGSTSAATWSVVAARAGVDHRRRAHRSLKTRRANSGQRRSSNAHRARAAPMAFIDRDLDVLVCHLRFPIAHCKRIRSTSLWNAPSSRCAGAWRWSVASPGDLGALARPPSEEPRGSSRGGGGSGGRMGVWGGL